MLRTSSAAGLVTDPKFWDIEHGELLSNVVDEVS